MAKRTESRSRQDRRDAGVPSIGEWMATQHLNSDPIRAEAARHVGERHSFVSYYYHDRVLRELATEDSEHLYGLQLLTQDYCDVFGLNPKEQFEELGVNSPAPDYTRVQCGHFYKSNKQCKRTADGDTNYCTRHGVEQLTEEERAEIATHISNKLAEAGDRAYRALVDLVDNAKSEMVRFQAANELLKMIGAGATLKIDLEVTGKAEVTAAEVRGRLLSLVPKDAIDVIPGEAVEIIETDEEESA